MGRVWWWRHKFFVGIFRKFFYWNSNFHQNIKISDHNCEWAQSHTNLCKEAFSAVFPNLPMEKIEIVYWFGISYDLVISSYFGKCSNLFNYHNTKFVYFFPPPSNRLKFIPLFSLSSHAEGNFVGENRRKSLRPLTSFAHKTKSYHAQQPHMLWLEWH